MDRIDGMRAFASVAQSGSFTSAARQLGMSVKLVSKYVGQLEDQLGARLLHRTTRKVSLSDAGEVYLQHCLPLLEGFDALTAAVLERHQALAGPIRMTAPTGFGSSRLPRALESFLARHAQVSVDLRLSDTLIDVVADGFDLAVRIGRMRDTTLIAKKIADMPLLPVASPDYLERRGIPNHPSELSDHECLIDNNHDVPGRWRFVVDGRPLIVHVGGRFEVNAPAAHAAMAAAGFGIALCPAYAVEDLIKAGTLRLLLEPFLDDRLVLHALFPTGRYLSNRVRALIDHLAVEMKSFNAFQN